MKKLLLTAAIILSLVWIYIIILNYSVQTEIIIPFGIWHGSTRTSWVLLCFGLFTCLIDGISFVWFLKSKTDLNRNYRLKMDKLSVQADSDKSQVKILENKIKTLEAALEKLTKGKNE